MCKRRRTEGGCRTGSLYYQGIGGTVWRVADPNAGSVAPVRMSFLPDYATNKAAYDSTVFISTPITTDSAGNIYFDYEAVNRGLKPTATGKRPAGTA